MFQKDNKANKTNKNNSAHSQNSGAKLDTLLGQNTVIKGDISFNGVLHLDGNITGSILGVQNDDIVTISETGSVDGKIEVANIVINGKIKGDLYASGKIEVASKAIIEGNVYYQNIEMEVGSKINGQLIYQEADKPNKIANIEDKKSK